MVTVMAVRALPGLILRLVEDLPRRDPHELFGSDAAVGVRIFLYDLPSHPCADVSGRDPRSLPYDEDFVSFLQPASGLQVASWLKARLR